MAQRQDQRLGPGILAAYGLTGLPLGALGICLVIYLPPYYAGELGLGLTTVGSLLLLARLWDVVTDPLVGALSDGIRTPWGRRRPWLIAGTPLLLLATVMLFLPSGEIGKGYLLTWCLVVYLGWSMVTLPYAAWGAELSGDYHERSRIVGARQLFAILGTLLAVGLPPLLDPGGTGTGSLGSLAWIIVALMLLGLIAMLIAVPDRTPAVVRQPRWREGLALIRRNRPFRRLLTAHLLNGIANGLPATLFVLFVTHRLAIPESTGPLLVAYFAAGILGVPLWVRLGKRFGKHRVWAAAMLWACAAFVWAPFLGAGDFGWFLAICLVSGVAVGADLALPSSIQADVVDVDTVDSGTPRTGLYFAIWSMASKLALGLAVAIGYPLLDLAGFDAAGENGPGALLVLALLYGGLPIAFKLVAIALIWGFPIDAAAQSRLRARIDGAVEQPAPA